MKYQHRLTAAAQLTSLTLWPGCKSMDADHGHGGGESANAFAHVQSAICVLSATNGSADLPSVSGTITFTQTDEGLRVQAQVSGLKPNSKHGFHVHMFGDISAANGTATGGHYNPREVAHGLPSAQGDHMHVGGHAGDLGNLEADANGHASYDITYPELTLAGMNAVLGRAIIVHAGEDDGGQPTGNAGARIAQGVIGIDRPGE